MWSAYLPFLLTAVTAFTSAAPSPLTTSATTVTTLSGIHSADSNNDGILIHVLRTEDLIADKIKSKPLLLERLSHLLIRVELGNQTVAVNGHHLPVLPGADRPLEISVKLKQVQMLKMPDDSPLVPLGLTPPELLNIADKYMSEGIVAAMLSVVQEPLLVEATREDNTPVQAEAFKVTIGMKILEVDGLSLAETDIPAVDLLHLIVHPDATNPSVVSTITTLAPEALNDPPPAQSPSGFLGHAMSTPPAGLLSSALASTRASLESSLQSLRNAVHGMAAHASGLLSGSHHRRPCAKHHHHQHYPQQQEKGQPAATLVAGKPIESAAVVSSPSEATPEKSIGRHSLLKSFRRKMICFIKAFSRSSILILLLGLPLALVFLLFTTVLSTLVRRRMISNSQALPTYQAIMVDEKLSDEEIVVLMSAVDAQKLQEF